MNQLNALALFPDRNPSVAGKVLDIPFEKVPNENFWRIPLCDKSFQGRKLCVCFFPSPRSESETEAQYAGIIEVVGFIWWKDLKEKSVVKRINKRVADIKEQQQPKGA
jgi:hypothetical protein